MTIEELNIKISADAENFKAGLAGAKAELAAFRDEASAAGKAVTEAFGGLLETEITSEAGESAAVNVTDAESRYSFSGGRNIYRPGGMPGNVPAEAIYYFDNGVAYSGTASVLDLDASETVVGAVGAAQEAQQPVNITTTVELDGDKVGESVNRFNLRRSKITNGMYQ